MEPPSFISVFVVLRFAFMYVTACDITTHVFVSSPKLSKRSLYSNLTINLDYFCFEVLTVRPRSLNASDFLLSVSVAYGLLHKGDSTALFPFRLSLLTLSLHV